MPSPSFDFANLLFAGPCNARCPACIGRQLDPRLSLGNLEEYPPRNLDAWLALIWRHAIRQVAFTGTTTDPQMYRHEERLLAELRARLPAETQFSLHTNGRLARRKWAVFNQYDRVCLSLPSFEPATYRQMMGVPQPPDLARLLAAARVPLKVSCLVDEPNRSEIPAYLRRCAALGLKRLALRKRYGERRRWQELLDWPALELQPCGEYRGNPVYTHQGLEVTLWDFEQSQSTAINLFSSGLISSEYLLARAG